MKKEVIFHINRIEGQVKGIGRMVESGDDPIDVVSQIMAAKSSLEKLAVRIIKKESMKCPRSKMDRLVDILFRVK